MFTTEFCCAALLQTPPPAHGALLRPCARVGPVTWRLVVGRWCPVPVNADRQGDVWLLSRKSLFTVKLYLMTVYGDKIDDSVMTSFIPHETVVPTCSSLCASGRRRTVRTCTIWIFKQKVRSVLSLLVFPSCSLFWVKLCWTWFRLHHQA